jgi:hypothetical protein
MCVYSEVHYITTDRSQKNFVVNYPVISDCIGKSFSKEKKWLKGTINYGIISQQLQWHLSSLQVPSAYYRPPISHKEFHLRYESVMGVKAVYFVLKCLWSLSRRADGISSKFLQVFNIHFIHFRNKTTMTNPYR